MGTRYIVLAIVAVGVGCYFAFFNDSPEAQIRKMLAEIEEHVEQDLPTQQIPQLQFGGELSKFAHEEFRFIQGEQNRFSIIGSKNDVKRYGALAPRYASSVEIDFVNISFLDVSNEKATAEVTLYYKVALRDGRTMEDQVTGNLHFINDGDWKISRAESLQVFR